MELGPPEITIMGKSCGIQCPGVRVMHVQASSLDDGTGMRKAVDREM